MCPLRLLACHLLGFDGLHERPAGREVCDGNIVQCEVEVCPMLDELGLYPGRHLRALAQQFLGVVLGHDQLEDLVSDRPLVLLEHAPQQLQAKKVHAVPERLTLIQPCQRHVCARPPQEQR